MWELVLPNGKCQTCDIDLCTHSLQKSNINVLMLLQRKLLTLFYIKGRVLVTLAQFMMKALLQEVSVNASDFISCCSVQAIKLLIFSPKRSSISYLFNY